MEGIHFAERSNFNCLIADEPGLGKTIQALGILHLHLDELKPVLIIAKASLTIQWQRYLITCLHKFAQIVTSKSDLLPGISIYITSFDTAGKIDWTKVNPKTIILDECQMIKNHDAKRTNAIRDIVNRAVVKIPTKISTAEKNKKIRLVETMAANLMKYHGINDRFNFHVYSHMGNKLGLCACKVKGEGIITGDIYVSKEHIEKDSIDEILETILHEIAHAITPGAGHRPIWVDTAKSIYSTGQAIVNCEGSVQEQCKVSEPIVKHKLFLSGTPIKNNAVEYWPALNLLRPQMFNNRKQFITNEVGYYLTSKGTYKPGGIKDPKEFQEKTKDFIIRRTKKEVLPDLPAITRDYRYHEMNSDESQAYALGVKKLDDFLKNANSKSFGFTSQLQSHIMILRHVTGLAKISPIMEYLDEWLEAESDSNRKIAIFHHHIDVGDILEKHIRDRNVEYVRIKSSMDVSIRQQLLDNLRNNPTIRFMIAPTLAMSEGYDLDYVDIGILLEREWNPANEEQVEGRFIRATPESIAKAAKGELKATVVYPVAVNTVDEYFAELVERKRQHVSETLDGKADHQWNESDIMLQLAQITVQKWKNI
jgi:SNF2 family DNA or RNA helicase